jgi:hypothetical protein
VGVEGQARRAPIVVVHVNNTHVEKVYHRMPEARLPGSLARPQKGRTSVEMQKDTLQSVIDVRGFASARRSKLEVRAALLPFTRRENKHCCVRVRASSNVVRTLRQRAVVKAPQPMALRRPGCRNRSFMRTADPGAADCRKKSSTQRMIFSGCIDAACQGG